jgi:hypothetical protein
LLLIPALKGQAKFIATLRVAIFKPNVFRIISTPQQKSLSQPNPNSRVVRWRGNSAVIETRLRVGGRTLLAIGRRKED